MAEVLPFDFSASFQERMLALMIADMSFALKVTQYISEERLFSDGHKYLFAQIKKKIDSAPETPSLIEIEDDLKKIERHKRRILKTFVQKIFEIKLTTSEIEFIKTKMTDYAKKSVFVDVFQAAQTYWNSKRHDEAFRITMEGMNDLYAVDFADDSDLDIERFEEARQVYLFKAGARKRHIPTMIDLLDEILRGGLERGEMAILLAQAKKGKSIGLVHMGAACLMMRFGRVAHFVLEGTTEQTVLRYQSRLTGIEYGRLEKEDGISPEEEALLESTGKKYMSNLTLVPFNQRWDYTVHDIEGKIRELKRHGKKPDLVIVDYGDLLKSKNRAESFRHEQTEVYRDLKKLAMIHDVAIWTACLDGATKIHTLHGHIPIRDLEGQTNIPVYAFNLETGKIEIQTIEKVFKTSDAAEVWELELDNGEKIRMTPNHRLMLRDGEYRRLDECKIGDSLMPLYQHEIAYGKNRRERYTVLNTRSPLARRKRESRMVAEWMLGRPPLSSEHVHHKDEDPLNNDPRNIELLSNSDHKRRHQLEKNWMKTPDGKKWWSENNCQFRSEVAAKTSQSMKRVWAERQNHKIVAIKKCQVLVPTYNMTVSPSHNYALSAGIIVKNSQAQRPSEDPDKVTLLRARDIAESFEKCRIADLVATLNQTPREKNDGIMRLHLDIYRSNDADKTMRLIQNFEKMIFYSKRLGRITDEDVPSWMRKTK